MVKGISTTKLAEICGVSQGTVDRALNNRKGINEETKKRILQVAEENGYRPNIHARAMKGGSSTLIGIVVPDLDDQYFSRLITEIEKNASEKGYSVAVAFSDGKEKRERESLEKLLQISVDGIVICPMDKSEELEKYLLSLNIPVVTVCNRLNNIPHVGINNTLATVEVTEHVISRGYEKLIYVKPPLGESNALVQSERLKAFVDTVQVHGKEYAISDMLSAMIHIDVSKRNALICPTDVYALKLYSIAAQQKIGIIGFDNLRIIDELNLRLDSVSYDIPSAAKRITDYITEGKEITGYISHKLIKRGSI